jgi:hypothetical protein
MKIKLFDYFIFSILITFFISGCSEEEKSVNPPSGNALINSSFEKNGQPSSDGWTIPSGSKYSNDVPPGGGSYSLELESNQPPEVYAEIMVPVLTQFNNYKLSFWSKSSGVTSGIYGKVILSLLRNGSEVKSISMTLDNIVWSSNILADTFSVALGDSFAVKLSGGVSQILPGKTQFDLCILEAVE